MIDPIATNQANFVTTDLICNGQSNGPLQQNLQVEPLHIPIQLMGEPIKL